MSHMAFDFVPTVTLCGFILPIRKSKTCDKVLRKARIEDDCSGHHLLTVVTDCCCLLFMHFNSTAETYLQMNPSSTSDDDVMMSALPAVTQESLERDSPPHPVSEGIHRKRKKQQVPPSLATKRTKKANGQHALQVDPETPIHAADINSRIRLLFPEEEALDKVCHER